MAKDFRQAMAEAGRQSVLDAIQSQPGAYEKAETAYRQSGVLPGGGGAPSGSSYGASAADLQKQAYELVKQWQQPAIQRMEATRPTIETIYGGRAATLEAEKEPLTQRYENLLADITKTTRGAAAAEFSRRGIPLSSGLVEKTVGERMSPQIERVGLEREAGLRGIEAGLTEIAGAKAGAYSDLEMAIAAIQAAAGPQAVQAGLSQYGIQEQSRQSELNRQIELQRLAQQVTESQWEQRMTEEQQAWERPWKEQLWAKELEPTTYKPTQYDKQTGLRSSLLEQAGKGATLSGLVSQFGGGLDISDIVSLYSGVGFYGEPKEPWAKKILGEDW